MRGLISPLKMVSNSKGGVAPRSFSRFMSGGNLSGERGSALVEASNNIINFSRANVKPVTPNITSIISNISTNIDKYQSPATQNVQNQVQNISQNLNKSFQTVVQKVQEVSQNQIQNISQNINKTFQTVVQRIKTDSQGILSSTIQKFTKDYQQKIQAKEDSQPSNVLKNFQGLYQNAIDFITFLGDSKTTNKIEKSLSNLRRIFEDTFDTSTAIRQAIVKIVKQLSNLPSASPNSGTLNLDVKIPGGPLKQAGGGAIRNFARSGFGRRMGMASLGVGAIGLGVGGLGLGMGMFSARKFQEEKLQSKAEVKPQEQMIPEDFVDNFGNVIEKFSASISNLIEFVKKNSGMEGPGENQQTGNPANPPGGLGNENGTIQGNVGEVLGENVSASYYDPSLGGINASGAKTKEGLPATSSGEGFLSSKFTAAAFPSLLRRLPSEMTTPSRGNPSGRTISSGKAFNVIAIDKNGKAAVIRVNDVGSGVGGQSTNRMLDFSPAVSEYFGHPRGNVDNLKIIMAPSNLPPGPISPEKLQEITKQSSVRGNQNSNVTNQVSASGGNNMQDNGDGTSRPNRVQNSQVRPASPPANEQSFNPTQRSPGSSNISFLQLPAPPPSVINSTNGGSSMRQFPNGSSDGSSTDVSHISSSPPFGSPTDPLAHLVLGVQTLT